MADPARDIYDDEEQSEGFYKNRPSLETGGSRDARKGALQNGEADAIDGSEKNNKLTGDEAAGLGFKYNPEGDKPKFTARFKANRKNVKKGLIGGGIAASLTGIIMSLFLSLLPLKLEFLVQNITQGVSSVVYGTIEERMEHMIGKYMTRRVFLDRAGPSTYTGNSLFGTLYGNWRAANFEAQLRDRFGIEFEPLRNSQPLTSADQVPNGWRVVTNGVASDAISETRIDLDLLDTDLRGRDTRRVIRQVTREMTRWDQVLQRRHIRRILRNKFDVPDWKVPDKVNDARSTYAERKLEAKRWLIRRSIGPFSARYAAFFSCLLGENSCGDFLKQDDPDITDRLGPAPEAPPPEPTPPSPADDPAEIDRYNREVDRYVRYFGISAYPPTSAEDLNQIAKRLAEYEGDTVRFRSRDVANSTDNIVNGISQTDANSSVDNFVAKLVTREFMQTLLKGFTVVGLVDFLAQIDQALQNGTFSEAMYKMRLLNFVSAATPLMTTNSQVLAGDLNAESVGILYESLDGFEQHPAYQFEYGSLSETASPLTTLFSNPVLAQSNQTRAVAYDCDENAETPDDLLTYEEPVCEDEKIRRDYEAWRESPLYEPFAIAFEAYRSTIGIIVGWFNTVLDFLLGPIVDALLTITGLDRALAWIMEWGVETFFAPHCTGVNEGGSQYSCLRGGTEAIFAQIGEEGVNGIGGAYLTDREVAELKAERNKQIAWEWQQEPLMTRLFSTSSSRSLLAGFVMNTPSSVGSSAQTVASYLSNPLHSFGSMISTVAQPAYAQTANGFNPFGIVHHGYPLGHEALSYEADEAPQLAECEMDVLPSEYRDPRTTAVINDEVEGAPLWPVYTTPDPCALDRTVTELGLALFSTGADGGLGYDYYDEGGSEFYAGDFDEEFGAWSIAGEAQ